MASVTLSYYVKKGLQRSAVLADKVAAIRLDRGELELLGLTLVSDTTSVAFADDSLTNTAIIRTLVLTQTAQGVNDFPNSTVLIAATQNLFGNQLAACVPGFVAPAIPAVS